MKHRIFFWGILAATVVGCGLTACKGSGANEPAQSVLDEAAGFDYTIADYNGEKAYDAASDIVGEDADIYWEANEWKDTVRVTYSGTSASVSTSNEKILSDIQGAYVTLDMQTNSVKNVEIIASGKSEDGQLKIYGEKKFMLTLNGLELTSTKGPAINDQCKKHVFIHLAAGTVNRLTDAATYTDEPYYRAGATADSEDRKGCLFSEGDMIFSGTGVLVVEGKQKNGLATDDAFYMRPGVTIYSRTTATAGKALKAKDDVTLIGGMLLMNTSGGSEYDSEENDTSSPAGVKAGGTMTIAGGTHTLKSTGMGGKGISADGRLEISGGNTTITTTGGKYVYNAAQDLTSSPKGIKADSAITISGGKLAISVTGVSDGSEGLESKSTLTITGGEVFVCAYDDAINASSDITISGGYVYAHGAHNDGIDANGNCYIQGGVIFAIGASSPEVAIDANTEQQKKLYVSGGTLVAIGGLEQGSSLTQTCYSSSQWSTNTWYALYQDGGLALAFHTPSSGGSSLVVSTGGSTTLENGVTVSGGTEVFRGIAYTGANTTGGKTVSLSQYSSQGGSPGGGGQPGGGGRPGGW